MSSDASATLPVVKEPVDDHVRKIWSGIQLTISEIRDLRADLNRKLTRWDSQAAEDRRQAAEDRRQAAEDRRQAAEDRRVMNETIDGIRKALAVIGKRGGEFVEIQREQGKKLDKLIDLTQRNTEVLNKHTDILSKHTGILGSIQKSLHGRANGKGNGRSA